MIDIIKQEIEANGEKVKNLCMEGFLSAIPRNLKVLIDRD